MKKPQIKPTGWLKKFLETQIDGLTGHIAAAGWPYDKPFWLDEEAVVPYDGCFWWPYEQVGYYIDGFVRTAILLGDKKLLEKAENYIYTVINNPDDEGYLGPKVLKFKEGDRYTRWSHIIFFRACLALYEYNNDQKIIDAMVKHYLGHEYDYGGGRDVNNIEIMLELYRFTGNKAFVDMALKTYKDYHTHAEKNYDRATDETIGSMKKFYEHGVTVNEFSKLGALIYRTTGDKYYLNVSETAYRKINKFYMLPGGVNSSSERMRNNLYDESCETCDVTDMTWTLHYLAQITDKIKYSDMIERAVFNAGIGSVTEDFKAHQYFSSANQIIINEQSNTAMYDRGNQAQMYGPKPFTACCTGNVNRFMPNYILNMWDLSGDTVTARMFGPSEVSGEIDGKEFKITQETTYPFDFGIEFSIKTKAKFTFKIRVPGWCKNLKVNGCEYKLEKGFVVVKIDGNAKILVEFNAEIEEKHTSSGVYFKRGPLVYCLGMKGERSVWAKHTLDGVDYPFYRMKPDKKWNYAIDTAKTPKYIAGKDTAWDVDKSLPYIEVSAKEVENWVIKPTHKYKTHSWDYVIKEVKETRTFTPRLPRKGSMKFADKNETIKLYPYGACKVRMTVLPIVE